MVLIHLVYWILTVTDAHSTVLLACCSWGPCMRLCRQFCSACTYSRVPHACCCVMSTAMSTCTVYLLVQAAEYSCLLLWLQATCSLAICISGGELLLCQTYYCVECSHVFLSGTWRSGLLWLMGNLNYKMKSLQATAAMAGSRQTASTSSSAVASCASGIAVW